MTIATGVAFSPSKVVVVCQEAKGMRVKDEEQFVSMKEDKPIYAKRFYIRFKNY